MKALSFLDGMEMEEASLRKLVKDTIRLKHPDTVAQLVEMALNQGKIDESDLISTIKEMKNDGSIFLTEPIHRVASVFEFFSMPTTSGWFWFVLSLTLISVMMVIVIPPLFPFSVLRWLLSLILVLYLPGFSLLKFLFPKSMIPDTLIRFLMSLGLSLIVDILAGLMLSYTAFGIRFIPVTATLAGFTVTVSIATLIREYAIIRGHRK